MLEHYKQGRLSKGDIKKYIARKPMIDMGFARIDNHRILRTGFPEVIYCKEKTPQQVKKIFLEMMKHSNTVIGTKASPKHYQPLRGRAKYDRESGIIYYLKQKPKKTGKIVVITAGTSDIPIAQEAAITAEIMGSKVIRKYDVGVAGVHRLLSIMDDLQGAGALIVVAGMEGALPTIVSGITTVPVIAVPTSVGYGVSFKGISALLTMLNSCSPGVSVVNIDNGFGAGYQAHMINLK